MNYEHDQILKRLGELDTLPDDDETFSSWMRAAEHIAFLKQNAASDEILVYGASDFIFAHAIAVPLDRLDPIDETDLHQWNMNPYSSVASYYYQGGKPDLFLERGLTGTGTKTLEGATQLIFGRTFEGFSGPDANYFELAQEYSHLTSSHWREEHGSYCRYDRSGDLEHVVTITNREESANGRTLITFQRNSLEEYLAVSRSALVRMFDFTIYRKGEFFGWPDDMEERSESSQEVFFRQRSAPGLGAYTRGVQIIRPRRPSSEIFASTKASWFGNDQKQHAEFIAHDWRNGCIANISTAPEKTTNYFEAAGNSLPFELSPAFFKPEVLLKYKGDRDKYTVKERSVDCRNAWHLRGIDVNEAGQIHAYICDLRKLPYEEQLHWKSFNVEPKGRVSERARTNDFEGEFTDFEDPLQSIKRLLDGWKKNGSHWWVLRSADLPDKVNVPLTNSRDEWAEAFMDLAKLVVEGFQTKPIRKRLDEAGTAYEKTERTISLLEKLIASQATDATGYRLGGLRTVQEHRSKAKGHAGGSEAQEMSRVAIREHSSYAKHFQHVCSVVLEELEIIETVCSQ